MTTQDKKIKFNRAELNWIERTADIETSRVFSNFNAILNIYGEENLGIDKTLLDKQINELIKLYTFLKALRSKLELWDCRYDIGTEIKFQKDDGEFPREKLI
jgi:hypothetical protein